MAATAELRRNHNPNPNPNSNPNRTLSLILTLTLTLSTLTLTPTRRSVHGNVSIWWLRRSVHPKLESSAVPSSAVPSSAVASSAVASSAAASGPPENHVGEISQRIICRYFQSCNFETSPRDTRTAIIMSKH